MLTGWNIILILKFAVGAVTVLLLASLVALAKGNIRLHGRINMGFFVLTITALIGLEVVVRFIDPQVFDYFDANTRKVLTIHLFFSLPSAALLPAMLFTGLTHRRRIHLTLAAVFGILWTGTFITGVVFLPHSPP
ncbi:MAG TPA: DUF420 domain-containing protein [Gemmataceae bacterium]|jgi:uncharacterized membrane protein YozB (DUF420 family)|nr:DUF420 domain-containing protein [Gemmataceae bacterium]